MTEALVGDDGEVQHSSPPLWWRIETEICTSLVTMVKCSTQILLYGEELKLRSIILAIFLGWEKPELDDMRS